MSLSDQQWCPTSVQVTVLQARGLRIKGKSGTNDAYAVMQVGKEKYQTSVAEKSVAPVWKEEAAFDLPPGGGGGGGGAERSTLHVHVLHRALVGPDKLLGQAVVNLLQLSEDKTRNKTEWFKLLDKTGKADKDRGEVLVDIQFMRNNMTASMFDLSAAGKSRSRLGKFKDKVRGKKKEPDVVSTVLPSFSQVLTDSEEEGNRDGDVAAGKDEKKKKHKMKSLFSPKSNLHKNMSQSMSVLPGKNSSLSGSQSSGLNVDSSEGKKKFKFMIHKRSGSSDSKDSSSGHQKHGAAEQSNVCINGSHVYCEEPQPRTSRIGSNFSLASSGHGSMEDVPESSPPSVDSLRAVRQYSPWTEEEEETAEVENIEEDVNVQEEEERIRMEEERVRKEEEERVRRQEEELERLAEEKRRQEEERRQAEEQRVKREEEERIRMEEEEKERREQEEWARRQEEERRLAEEKRRLEEERKRQREEEERIRMEEERALEEKRRQEEERARRQEEEQRLAEEKRRLEEERTIEEEILRKEEEERVRREKEKAEEERRRQEEEMMRRQEEEREEKRRLEEQERRQKEKEERARREKEEMERLAEEKRRLEEQERRQREEEERAKKEKEEMERLAEEKRRLEEQERRQKEEEERAKKEKEEMERLAEEKGRLEEQERRQKEEEERARKEKEEMERLAEEKRRLEEQERRQREEEERARKEKEEMERLAEEKRRLEEQERRQKEEEERARKEKEKEKEKEEMERLAEEKRRLEEQERRRIEEEERIKREEEEARRLEKEKDDAEEQKKKENTTKHKAAEMKSEAAVASTNPFDEDISSNPFDEDLNSPAEPEGSTANQRSQSAVTLVGNKTASCDDKALVSSQRERRTAPQPPGRSQAERQSQREQEGSKKHLAQISKQSKDKDAKTFSAPPQRSVQSISPLSSSPRDAKNTQTSTQSSTSKGTTNVGKHSKRPAPSRPPSVEGGPTSEPKTAPPSDGNISHVGGSKQKQEAIVHGLNPFEDDEDENESTAQDDTACVKPGPIKWPPPVSPSADKDAVSQTKVKSSKIARAPPVPGKKADISTTLSEQNTGEQVRDDAEPNNNSTHDTSCSKSETISPLHVQESPPQESQPATEQSAREEACGRKEGPPIPSRRLQPVKPLNPSEQQPVSVTQGEKDKKSTGVTCEVQEKTKVNDTALKGPYSQLTRQELISLVLKQENQLTERDKKISELEEYIDKLLVRVIEEKPSILLSMNSLNKAA